jgi:hypothetical protein
MKSIYSDHGGSSGITHFTVMPDAVAVYFGPKRYVYSHASAGKEHVDTMKRLAAAGSGLASYIAAYQPQHVTDKE